MHAAAHRTDRSPYGRNAHRTDAPANSFTSFMCKSAMPAALLGLLLIATPNAHAAGASGQTIGLTCVACHGPGGKGAGAIPPLAGRSADQLYAAMKAFKDGSRPATVMDRHAKGYSDEELRAVSEYFASLPAK